MSRTYFADSDAPVSVAWSLLAQPARWPEWSPHVRGGWGLGSPEVEAGRRGAARLLWVVPVPAHILANHDRSWVWRVGPVTMDHRVVARAEGSRISITISGPLSGPVGVVYGPLVQALVRRLAAVADAQPSGHRHPGTGASG